MIPLTYNESTVTITLLEIGRSSCSTQLFSQKSVSMRDYISAVLLVARVASRTIFRSFSTLHWSAEGGACHGGHRLRRHHRGRRPAGCMRSGTVLQGCRTSAACHPTGQTSSRVAQDKFDDTRLMQKQIRRTSCRVLPYPADLFDRVYLTFGPKRSAFHKHCGITISILVVVLVIGQWKRVSSSEGVGKLSARSTFVGHRYTASAANTCAPCCEQIIVETDTAHAVHETWIFPNLGERPRRQGRLLLTDFPSMCVPRIDLILMCAPHDGTTGHGTVHGT